jgi:hypothetical protein
VPLQVQIIEFVLMMKNAEQKIFRQGKSRGHPLAGAEQKIFSEQNAEQKIFSEVLDASGVSCVT